MDSGRGRSDVAPAPSCFGNQQAHYLPLSDSAVRFIDLDEKESDMRHVLKNERGIALALAIVALMVVGALIAGALFAATQEQRVSENVRRVMAAFGVAEEGVYDIIRDWGKNSGTYAGLYPFPAKQSSVVIDTTTSASKTGSYSGTLFKINDQLYLIDVTAQDNMSLAGRVRGGGASQRLGLLVRIKPLMLGPPAALTLRAQDFPPRAAPSLWGGPCNPSVPTNGESPNDPAGPCGQYFPIIHITGTGAAVSGQEGQGVLLVDGSLDVQGGFQFFGVVIIKGKLRTSGGGGNPAHFWGTMMVQDSVALADTTNTIVGNANIMYSKCAIIKALDKTGVGTMLRSRGWVQLY